MACWRWNHEYIDNGMLFTDGTANWNLADPQGAERDGRVGGGSEKSGSDWQVVRPSSYAPPHYRQYADAAYRPARHQT